MSTTSTQPVHGSYLMPTLEHATVSDAMHPGILCCDPDATLTEIARLMASHHVHCVAVMGISHDHGEKLAWGIVSDLDLLRESITNRTGQTAAAIKCHETITVEPATPLREAAELMLTHRASHLLVLDPQLQRPTGMLSTLDIAGMIACGAA